MGKGFHTTVVFNQYLMIGERHAELIQLGVKAIMYGVKAEAKKLVRVDTTTLQKSIAFRNVSGAVYQLYTNVEYAVYVEYGTNGNEYFPPMPAKPFMFPAAKNGSARIEAMCGAIMAQG